MALPGLPSPALSMGQSQAQWDAIAAIQSNSPFATASSASAASSLAGTLDSTLAAYGDPAAAASGSAGDTLAAVTQRVRDAQQSTIDLFA